MSLTTKCAALQLQLEEARDWAKPTSISTMRKPDLVEVAHPEFDLRPDQAEKFTVLALRELLRELIREERGNMKIVIDDPLVRLPKGMTLMRRDELIHMCEMCDINLSVKPMQAEMMSAIRAQVDQNPRVY